jgi:hypothetical protein
LLVVHSATAVSCSILQIFARDRRAVAEDDELRLGDLRMNAAAEAAFDAGDEGGVFNTPLRQISRVINRG